jgi:hypothetical protein
MIQIYTLDWLIEETESLRLIWERDNRHSNYCAEANGIVVRIKTSHQLPMQLTFTKEPKSYVMLEPRPHISAAPIGIFWQRLKKIFRSRETPAHLTKSQREDEELRKKMVALSQLVRKQIAGRNFFEDQKRIANELLLQLLDLD